MEVPPKEEMENVRDDDLVGDPLPPNLIAQHRGRIDDPPRTNLDYSRPNLQGITSSIVRP